MITDQIIEDIFGDIKQQHIFAHDLLLHPLNNGLGSNLSLKGIPEELELTAKLLRNKGIINTFVHTSSVQAYINQPTQRDKNLWNKLYGDIWYNNGKYKIDLKLSNRDPDYTKMSNNLPAYCVGSIDLDDVDGFNSEDKFFYCIARNGKFSVLIAGDILYNYIKEDKIRIRQINNTKFIVVNDLPTNDNTLYRFIV